MIKQMLRCAVCGELLPLDTTICPVCGAGGKDLQPVEINMPDAVPGTDAIVLILGGGAAAFHAAQAFRERDRRATVVMLTDEPIPPYHRPMLTKAVHGIPEGFAMRDAAWYAEQNILVLTNNRVQSLDTAKKQVRLAGGEILKYDKCIYALGADCFIPPYPGIELPGVLAIRRLSDIERLRAMLSEGSEAAVIGGGVLGLEAAWMLREMGLSVTVLEAGDRLMPRQLDPAASETLRDAAEKCGVRVVLGAKTHAILGASRAEGVRLEDGSVISCQIVIVSCGVRANIGVAKDAGIETGRAVVVNERMETGTPSVYACGDCAEYAGANTGIWPVAAEMGRIAGANAAEDALAYRMPEAPMSLVAFGMSLRVENGVATLTAV